jgi:hypothetical protein
VGTSSVKFGSPFEKNPMVAGQSGLLAEAVIITCKVAQRPNAHLGPRWSDIARRKSMKKLMILMLSAWCGCAVAQTAQELIDNGKNPENVTTRDGLQSQPVQSA